MKRRTFHVYTVLPFFVNVSVMNESRIDSLPSCFEIAQMIDVSAVQANSTMEEVQQVVQLADEFDCIAAFALGEQTIDILERVRKINDRRGASNRSLIKVGGVVGFPDGGAMTTVKTFEAQRLAQIGCDEIDMVMNVGLALSGDWNRVKSDIAAVRESVPEKPLKVILECGYLSDEQILQAATVAMEAGTNWVKSGTGWTEKKTSVHTIELMKQAVGNRCQVKAAGGVRDLETLWAMYQAGARRFGIGVRTARKILEAAKQFHEQ